MTQQPTLRSPAVGGYVSKASVTERRKQMPFRVDTSSTTARGFSLIRGVGNYPAQPEIHFTREAWVKQCHLVDKCNKEVGWFALVNYDEDNNVFIIEELVIPKQTVSASETDIGKDDLADAALELIEQGKDTSKLYAWFHSHVNMGVSPSAQDEYQVEDFLQDLVDVPEVPAFIRGIQNKKGDLKLDVYYIQHGIAYQNVEFYVIHDDDPAWFDEIDATIKDKVFEQTYQSWGNNAKKSHAAGAGASRWNDYTYNGYGGFGGYDDYDDYDGRKALPPASTLVGEAADGVTSPPRPVAFMDGREWYDLEQVHHDPETNVDVVADEDGELYVCDARGDLFDYDDYLEYYGDITGTLSYPPAAG